GNFKNFTDPGGGVLECKSFHSVFITVQDGLSLNVGGKMDTRYDGLTFVLVRGAGHEVPLYRPQLALVLVKAFLSGTAMPTLPQVITDY
ncbi:hypothetical protein GIB67_015984, partial [Kingdonia uniflora]